MGVNVVMRTFGLILSLLLIVGFVQACPINSTTLTTNMVVGDGICENMTIFLYSSVHSPVTVVDSINVTGNLILRNSTLSWYNGSLREIIVENGAFLSMNSVEITAVNPEIDLTIDVMPNSTLILDSINYSNIDMLKLLGDNSSISLNDWVVNPVELKQSKFIFNHMYGASLTNLEMIMDYVVVDNSNAISFENITVWGAPFPGVSILNSDDVTFRSVGGGSGFNLNISFYNANGSIYGGTTARYKVHTNSTVNLYDTVESYVFLNPAGKILNYYSTDILVQRKHIKTPIGLADISIFDVFNWGSPVDVGHSNLAGEYFVYLKEYEANLSGTYYFSNYTVNVSKLKYADELVAYNVTAANSLVINLSTAKGIIKSGIDCDPTASSDFCVDANPKSNLNCKSMLPGDSCEVLFNINVTDNLGGNSSTLFGRNFSFFAISESSLPEITTIESSTFDMTAVSDYS